MPVIPFGKFKGKDLTAVGSGYLIWLRNEEWFEEKYPDLAEDVGEEIQIRERSKGHFWED